MLLSMLEPVQAERQVVFSDFIQTAMLGLLDENVSTICYFTGIEVIFFYKIENKSMGRLCLDFIFLS